MRPSDRVLVGILPHPRDLELARDRGWYRVPASKAPQSMDFQYLAFYQTAKFGDERWSIRYYAPVERIELVKRRDLLPNEPDHPRADEQYYRLDIGYIYRLERPIVSQTWRRVTFIPTTWRRLMQAEEIHDLLQTESLTQY